MGKKYYWFTETNGIGDLINAEETEPQAKTFMGFELVDIPLTSEIIERGKVNGSEAHYVLRLLYDNNLIKHMGDRTQAFMLLQNADDIANTRNIAESVKRYSENKGDFI